MFLSFPFIRVFPLLIQILGVSLFLFVLMSVIFLQKRIFSSLFYVFLLCKKYIVFLQLRILLCLRILCPSRALFLFHCRVRHISDCVDLRNLYPLFPF